MPRRTLLAIALLAAILHGVGIARSPLPAQDGLKFLRVAREFRSGPWVEAVRDCDQHPLYPAMIALTHPVVSTFAGTSAESWRLTAQIVSAIATILTLIPIYLLTRTIFDASTGVMAALFFVVLPIPAEVGHDTLSDPLALLGFAWVMALGASALRTRRLAPAIGCGIAAGLGYLARPEVAITPLAIVVAGLVAVWRSRRGEIRDATAAPYMNLVALAIPFLAMVGSYAVMKGEVSEKLAIRRAVGIPSVHDAATHGPRLLPPGLDDPRWDFSAKEESGASGRMGFVSATSRLLTRWSEAMGLALVPLVFVGAWLGRSRVGLFSMYAALFSAILIRHAMTFGYLSSRHTLTLVIVALPFASAGVMACVRAVRERRPAMSSSRTLVLRSLAVIALLSVTLAVQFHRPPHQSRWGHGEAGKWLAAHADPGQKVLDTRGWAAFVSGRSAHDYWHVRQALLDPQLAFVVVGEDERSADSRRGETLRALLAYAAEPVAEFPERKGGQRVGVRVYRFHPPSDWRGIAQ